MVFPALASAIIPANTYTDWNIPEPCSVNSAGHYQCGFFSSEQTIAPLNLPGVNASYFYASQFYFYTVDQGEGTGGYMGLQKDSRGRRAIFSIWSAMYATAAPGGTAGPFDGEGAGYQAAIPYGWQANHSYRFQVIKESNFGAIFGATAWGGYIRDLTTMTPKIKIGTIYIPSANRLLQGRRSNFTEYYGDHYSTCAMYPRAAVHFLAPSGNNTHVYAVNKPRTSVSGGLACPASVTPIWYGNWLTKSVIN